MVDPGSLRPRHAFDAMLASLPVARSDHPLIVSQPIFAIATIMARDGGQGAIADMLGCDLPAGPGRSMGDRMSVMGTGPGAWLAMEEGADSMWSERLAVRLAEHASVADQSSGYAVLRLRGAAARDVLQRGLFVDLDPCAFGPGSVAVSMIAHIGVIVWQADPALVFEIAIFRSQAQSFWHWMVATAVAMGISISRDW